MKIDNDLMDGDTTRDKSVKEDDFIIDARSEGLVLLTHDNDYDEIFILGRQYERNQQRDDGK